jgi:hypothetical protein
MLKPNKPNATEQKRRNQQTMDFYAALANKPTTALRAVAPKREKTAGPRAQPTEHQEQVRVIHWWRHACKTYAIPEFALFAIPNGGKRDVIEATHLKAEGVRVGVPDLFLAVPSKKWGGLFIEMKSTVGRPGANQPEFLEMATKNGYAAHFAYGSDEAIEIIKDYLGLL